MSAPLAAYETACLRMRQEAEQSGNQAVAALAKGLSVSLIGKLHAYDETWEECAADYNDPICGTWLGPARQGGLTTWRAVAGQVSRRVRTGLAWCAVPEVACWIWAAGRNWLWERMSCAGISEVLYADTDGLVVTARGHDRLGAAGYIREGEWGQLRLVAGPVEVEVLGPKMVRLGSEIIQAGAPKDQRGNDFAAAGYWFRAPFPGNGDGWNSGVFEEQYREYKKID